MSERTSSDMPLQPSAEVSEDSEPLVSVPEVDTVRLREETTHTRNLRLIAENTRLRLRVMALEAQLSNALERLKV
jgi:hypothetical protein